ncbi:metallopeptidase TldD-related protein [Methylophilaceae bacterium]|nr:metallopeptidase TldD-related protein [Methylophilaceae bacterium]
MHNEILGYTEEKLKNLCEDIIAQSKKQGVESAEVDISISSGKNLTVRNEDIETFEINNDKNISLTLYLNGRKSVVSSSDFSKKTIQHLIDNSLNMLKVTEQDPYFGIVEQDLHPKQTRPVDIFYPQELSFDEMLEVAKQAESAAKYYDEQITNSEGASINYSSSIFMYANSNKFFGGFPGSRYSLYCSVIGSKGQTMQRSYDYSNVRDFQDLKNPIQLGEEAAKNTIDRLNVKKIKTGNYPIIFHNTISDSLINPILSAISGRNLYRQNSFLLDSVGTKIASDGLTIREQPLLPKGHASTYFDDEGVEVFDNTLIDRGELKHYLLSSYSAKKLNLSTTGNAGGTHNLIFEHHNISLAQMIKDIKKGFLITELLGHGVNMVNGDFSRGAAGLYIENGEIQHAVEEITIAGNLKDMAMDISSIADDINSNSSKYIGSVLIEKMAVGAS